MDPPKKPPDPNPPEELFKYSPVLTITLPHEEQGSTDSNVMDQEPTTRKRPALTPTKENKPPKLARTTVGRQAYNPRDLPPYLVHVSRIETDASSGTTLQPVKFGMFLMRNNISNILKDGVKRIGRNRVSVEFQAPEDANKFLTNRALATNNYAATIPQFNITRMGLVRDVPAEWTEEEIIGNVMVPEGCGLIIKARRINRKVTVDGTTEWKPTQTVVLTFDGQILPKRVYCFYSALPVEQYTYPTVQCFNCCRFGHTRLKCRSKPRCYRCGHDHSGDSCTVTSEEAFCISCSGSHYANDSACPELGRQKSIKAVMAEKSVSYNEASKRFPPVSRSYADIAKSKVSSNGFVPVSQAPKSYKKTVLLKPKSHAPLSPSYDKQAHQSQIRDYSFSPSKNGCALLPETRVSNNSQDIVALLMSLITTVLSNNISIPDHVAIKLNSLVNFISNIPSPDIPAMEREERFSQET